MKLNALAATLLIAFSLTSCHEIIEVGTPPPPQSYMVCEQLPDTPSLEPLQAFEASNGALVYYKADVDARDAQIAPYVVELRGAWFSCSNQLQRVSDYYELTE
jgi:hypothetical protein